jgi:hypothetical protein
MAELRNRLEREAERVHLGPEALDGVYRGHRRKEVRRRVTAGLTAGALTIAVGIWLAASFLNFLPGSDRTPAGPPSPVAIVGTYRTALPRSDPEVAELRVAGTYTLRLRQNGVIQLSTPPGFEDAHESASGDAYRVTGNVVTIGSFTTFSCPGTVGTYRIELTATELRLAPIDEPCALRATIFSSRPWSIV